MGQTEGAKQDGDEVLNPFDVTGLNEAVDSGDGFRRRAGGHVLGPGAGAVRRSEEIHVIKLEPEQLRDEGVSLLPSCRCGE